MRHERLGGSHASQHRDRRSELHFALVCGVDVQAAREMGNKDELWARMSGAGKKAEVEGRDGERGENTWF